jgi:hypothetical protein
VNAIQGEQLPPDADQAGTEIHLIHFASVAGISGFPTSASAVEHNAAHEAVATEGRHGDGATSTEYAGGSHAVNESGRDVAIVADRDGDRWMFHEFIVHILQHLRMAHISPSSFPIRKR